MAGPELPRIMIVDDEEAILETMTFTFMDTYEVLTATDPVRALEIFDSKAPIAVVLSDQRMPHMTGVEFLKEVYERHTDTVRIILTGFADSEATIDAINDGHVYAYVNKPWEPLELKQVVKRAVEHHQLSRENKNLLETLRAGNVFLEAVMDRFEAGAIAVDAEGVIQAANQPARCYLELGDDPRGERLEMLLNQHAPQDIADAVGRVSREESKCFEDLDVRVGNTAYRMRISTQALGDPGGDHLGRVIFFKEISHEPLRRRFDEEVAALSQHDGDLRARFAESLDVLARLDEELGTLGIVSPSMAQLVERVSRTRTAIQSWLEVDDALQREDYPDAQLLIERMRLASRRWPQSDALPTRVADLVERVEAYYESGDNPQQRVL